MDESVTMLLAEEREAGMDSASYYMDFGSRVDRFLANLRELIDSLHRGGHRIAIYGASAKGSTLLNALGVDPACFAFIADRSTAKQGKRSPGLHLPIVPPDALVARRPDFTLLLSWNFADEILAQQQEYRDLGGKFIIPVPEVRIV